MQLGADPEFFILDKSGKPVSAHKFFRGKEDKHCAENPSDDWTRYIAQNIYDPRVVGNGGYRKRNEEEAQQFWKGTKASSGNKLFRDGFAVEFNPFTNECRDSLANNFVTCVVGAQEMLGEDYKLHSLSTVAIDVDEDLKGAPADLLTFGCDPSWDAYTGEKKVAKVDAMTHPFRYAGGHMHFSTYKGAYTLALDYKSLYSNGTTAQGPTAKENNSVGDETVLLRPEDYPLLVKMFDLYVGLPLTYIYESDLIYARREVYGQAGEYRPQKYGDPYMGVEYRSPGPEMWRHMATTGMAFSTARFVIRNFQQLKETWNKDAEPFINVAMNTGKGLEELLPRVPYIYDQDMLKAVRLKAKKWTSECFVKMAHKKPSERFKAADGDITALGHTGWGDLVTGPWNMKFPEPTEQERKTLVYMSAQR